MSEKSDYLKSYIGKRCTIYMSIYWYGVTSGFIEKCENGWLTLKTKGKAELIKILKIRISEKDRYLHIVIACPSLSILRTFRIPRT